VGAPGVRRACGGEAQRCHYQTHTLGAFKLHLLCLLVSKGACMAKNLALASERHFLMLDSSVQRHETHLAESLV
jgi:hypothetical protein